MTSPLPITVRSIIKLTDPPYDLPESAFRYGFLSIESDHYICVRYPAPDKSNVVVVIDLYNNNKMSRKPTKKAEAALMHTNHNIIVLKGRNQDSETGHFIQIFDLDNKKRLLDHVFEEDVVFWKWASDSLLAIVTASSVWHCFLEPSKPPVKVFDRAGRLAEGDIQIIHYTVDKSETWSLLVGIYSNDKKTVEGVLQLYSLERKQQQILQGYTGCFGSLMVSDIGNPSINVFCFTEKKENRFIFHVMHIETPKSSVDASKRLTNTAENPVSAFKIAGQFSFPDDLAQDFPIGMHLSSSDGLIYMISRGGYLILLDPFTGTLLLTHRVSTDTVFAYCPHSHLQLGPTKQRDSGILCVNRKGVVYWMNIDETALVPYIQRSLVHLPMYQELALSFVRRYGYSGNKDVLLQLFNAAFTRGDWGTAARIVATAKTKDVLRTPEILYRFKSVPASPGSGMTPILQYFTNLLDHDGLNGNESIELIRTVVSQNHVELVQKWLDQDKLTCTEELGDIVKQKDPALALQIYNKAHATTKVLQSCIEQGKIEKIGTFINQMRENSRNLNSSQSEFSSPDFIGCLETLISSGNPASIEASVKLAQELLSDRQRKKGEVEKIINIFVQRHRYKEVTKVLLEYLKDDLPEDADLQTKLFELCFIHNPNVVEAIFQTESFTHFDRQKIGTMAEEAGLIQRALQLATTPEEIKRLITTYFHGTSNCKGRFLTVEQFLCYFDQHLVKNVDLAMECLQEICRSNSHNVQFLLDIAIKHYEVLGCDRLIALFESCGYWEGVYKFLGSLVAFSTNPTVHYKYIEAAAMLNNTQEVERMCRESSYYDPVKVKDFLKKTKLLDPRPLIYVCDLHGFVGELTEYLYQNGFTKYIEIYVLRVSPQKAPLVVGTLLDLDCSENFIKNMIQSLRGSCSVPELIEEVEKRNRLRMLKTWLEARASEGNQDPHLHNALAKISIDTNDDPESFLKNNVYYDSKTIGKYCEKRDPHLALIAYKKDGGGCDEEIIALTNSNSFFRFQAKYLLERNSKDLWTKVLTPSNPYRDVLVEQVVSCIVPQSTSANEIFTTVSAFVDANLPNALIDLLEKILLYNSPFSQNQNLQNLLIITAVKSSPEKVNEYIDQFDCYDEEQVCQILLSSPYKMYEEAFRVYDKAKKYEKAVMILLTDIKDMERAIDYGLRVSVPAVWSCIGNEQLIQNDVSQAIDSFIKAQDSSNYLAVIQRSSLTDSLKMLEYLQMVRGISKIKDSAIDTELLYVLAKTKRFSDIEDFVAVSNTADIGLVADRLFTEEVYDAAEILYSCLPNYSKVVACHLKQNSFSKAIEAAKKANNLKSWTDINISSVNAGDLSTAHIAGLHLLDHPDYLEELIRNYEYTGHFFELIELLEEGVANSHRPSVALLTELGIVYAKYNSEKLASFLRNSVLSTTTGKLNVPKLIRVCEKESLWSDCVYLHVTYGEFDQAASIMINHPSTWSHAEFISVIRNATNTELIYKALSFYLEIAPLQLCNLLMTLCSKLDHGRVVQQFRKCGHLKLIQKYLEHLQTNLQLDITVVNVALIEIYMEEQNFESLDKLIQNFKNFDQIALARDVESHESVALRKLAALLYRRNNRFNEAVTIFKKENMDMEAIEAAEASGNSEITEDLLRFLIVERKNINLFIVCLVRCYSLIRPDVVLELAWRYKCTEEIMPFLIQTLREYSTRINTLEKRLNSCTGNSALPLSKPISSDFGGNILTTGPLSLASPVDSEFARISDTMDLSQYTMQLNKSHFLH